MPKNAIFGLFFKILPAAQKFRPKKVFIVVWESSENQFGRPKNEKKKVIKILKNI